MVENILVYFYSAYLTAVRNPFTCPVLSHRSWELRKTAVFTFKKLEPLTVLQVLIKMSLIIKPYIAKVTTILTHAAADGDKRMNGLSFLMDVSGWSKRGRLTSMSFSFLCSVVAALGFYSRSVGYLFPRGIPFLPSKPFVYSNPQYIVDFPCCSISIFANTEPRRKNCCFYIQFYRLLLTDPLLFSHVSLLLSQAPRSITLHYASSSNS